MLPRSNGGHVVNVERTLWLKDDDKPFVNLAQSMNKFALNGGSKLGGWFDLCGGNVNHLAHRIHPQAQFDLFSAAAGIKDDDAGFFTHMRIGPPKA